jgi:hypothetical protein
VPLQVYVCPNVGGGLGSDLAGSNPKTAGCLGDIHVRTNDRAPHMYRGDTNSKSGAGNSCVEYVLVNLVAQLGWQM